MNKIRSWNAHVLVRGEGSGTPLVLPEPLSLWGGLDPHTGEITDRRHPCSGENVAGRVMILPAGRGSSSASSILLEAVRAGTAPAAIITSEIDGILALGAVVAQEIYEVALPVVVVGLSDYDEIGRLLQEEPNVQVRVEKDVVSLNVSNPESPRG